MRVAGDAFYFGELLRHAGFDRRLVVLILDAVKRRSLERQRAWRIERIGRAELRAARALARRPQAEDGSSGNEPGIGVSHAEVHSRRMTMGWEVDRPPSTAMAWPLT